MTRNIEFSAIGREPHQGELTYELKRILSKHCPGKPMRQAAKSVQIAVARLARRFGFDEFECKYSHSTALTGRAWVDEVIEVLVWRKRSNGTTSIYRAGASRYPHFFTKEGKGYANLGASKDMTIFYGVDEPYSWQNFYRSKKLPARIERKIAKAKEKTHAHS